MTEIKTTIDFDPDFLRERYKSERDKRIRPDGNEQYLEATGSFLHFSKAVSYTHLTLPTTPYV